MVTRKKAAPELLKLDLGCGKNKKEGFVGVDSRKFPGVDVVCDLGKKRWPWKDNTVDEVHCSHMLEHLVPAERIHFINELYRVLKKGSKATIITPYWGSVRAYGDLTHQWPPVVAFWYFYLRKEWRDVNAPHNDEYKCDFDSTWGFSLNEVLSVRNEAYRQHAVMHYLEAAQDMWATVIKR